MILKNLIFWFLKKTVEQLCEISALELMREVGLPPPQLEPSTSAPRKYKRKNNNSDQEKEIPSAKVSKKRVYTPKKCTDVNEVKADKPKVREFRVITHMKPVNVKKRKRDMFESTHIWKAHCMMRDTDSLQKYINSTLPHLLTASPNTQMTFKIFCNDQ